MSCQINNIAHISIVDKVKSKLGLIERSAEQPTSGDDDEDNWDWDWQEASTSSDASTQSSTSSKDSQWLQQCCISLSPTGKVLVLTHDKQIVILNAFLDAREQTRETRTEYNIVSHANICEPGEEITAVLCVPLLSQLKSLPSGTDWTCIVVGFSSGYVRFYTENKTLLAGEQFHGEPVTHLKCQSFRRASHSAASEQAEELYVVYPTCVVTLPGFSLFQTLKACRNPLARAQASGSGSMAPPLVHSKWGFPDQEMINDCQVVGSTSVNTFDHLMTASVCGGFDAVVKASAPAHSLVIALGRKPYVGYHFTFEGNSQPILLGVARAMANTIKSSQGLLAIKSYFTGSKSQKEKKPVSTVEPAEPMGCRFGLCDLWRQGEHIVPAPNRLLSVVCDSLGRVILLDTHLGTVLRMWKGYRDAQCAWIEVKEPLSRTSPQAAAAARTKHRPRVALFLVVYAPKKGIIEVWAMQQGPKVASFSVSKGGRLLYTNYGHVGVNNVPVKGSSRSQLPCIYVDPNGALREIVVPFHFSLSAQNSKQARDMHLLKKLRQLLRDCRNEEVAGSEEEVGRLVQDLWGSEAGLQALDVLTGSKNTKPNHMLAALNSLLGKLDSQGSEEMDLGSKTLQHTCKQLLNLVNFFVFVEEQNSEPPTYESVVTTKNATAQELATELLTPEKEMELFLNLVSDITSIIKETTAQPRVKFQDDAQSMFIEFLSCFETSSLNANLQRPVAIKQDIPEENLKRTSLQIFQGWLKSDGNFDEWLSQAQTSGIQAQSFLRLSLHFWLQFHQSDSSAFATVGAEMLIFGQLLKGICSLAAKDEISVECNDLSVWWQAPRNILTNSDRPLRALTAAIVCRGVGLYLEKCKECKDDAKEAENAEEAMEVDGEVPTNTDWERVSMDTMQWNALSRHLEDLALLEAVLQVKLKTKLRCLPHSLKWKPASVSLKAVLNKGKGAVSELVACWLASSGLEPSVLIESKEEASADDSMSPVPASKRRKELEQGVEATDVDPDETQIMDLVGKLRLHFPFSVSSNPLLASLFWEYIQDRSQTMNNPSATAAALHILKSIPSSHLRQGMCNLLWSFYLKQDFEKIARAMNKKTKVQLSDMGLHEGQLPSYLDFLVQFLEAFLEANEESEVETIPELGCEELWSESEVPPSLSQVALSKPSANFELLDLHLQLATILHMVAVFDLKVTSVLTSLFDFAGQAALFCDLSSRPRLPSHNPGFKLTSSRTQFLCRVISASMQTILVVDAGDSNEGECIAPKVDASAAALWMRKCLVLANSWGVNSDTLRRHQICDLYMSGFDRLAEEILSSVTDEAMLGSQLLLLAGQRLNLAIINSSNISEKMSNISPALSNWLQSVEKVNSQFCASSVADVEQLVSHVARMLPDGHQDLWLVHLLLDSCRHFINTADENS